MLLGCFTKYFCITSKHFLLTVFITTFEQTNNLISKYFFSYLILFLILRTFENEQKKKENQTTRLGKNKVFLLLSLVSFVFEGDGFLDNYSHFLNYSYFPGLYIFIIRFFLRHKLL